MPELPEVENVRRSLRQEIQSCSRLERIQLFRKDLRFVLPAEQMKTLLGEELQSIERKGKYILFIFSKGILVSHLGMTGRWRVTSEAPKLEKHDHVQFYFSRSARESGGGYLTYNDARRFGYIEFIETWELLEQHPFFAHLGVEPLSSDLSGDYLFLKGKQSQRPVKVFLMDQSVVVGVGNIYASEILFRAKVRPSRKAKAVKRDEWGRIANATKEILERAISAGGSSIRDYRNSKGEEGSFQSQHQVYGKVGKPCARCGHKVKTVVLGGRSTFWCPHCQK